MKTYEAFISQEDANKLRNLRIISRINYDTGLPFKPSKREIELLKNFKFKLGDYVRPTVDYFFNRRETDSIFVVDCVDLRTLPFLLKNSSGPYAGNYNITNIKDDSDTYWIKEKHLSPVSDIEVDALKYNI